MKKFKLGLIAAGVALAPALLLLPPAFPAEERYPEVYSGVPARTWQDLHPEEAREVRYRPEKRFYLGLGGIYNLRHGRGDTIGVLAVDAAGREPYLRRIGPKVDDGFGFQAKAGYLLRDWLALETRFNWHLKYGLKGDDFFRRFFPDSIDYVDTLVDGGVEVYDIMLNAKFYVPDLGLRPFFVFGLGYMGIRRSWDEWARVETLDLDSGRGYERITHRAKSNSSSGLAARIGIGVEYFFTERLGADVEISYNNGYGGVGEVEFVSFTLGALVAF